ncbi:class F sortase [Nocardioides sp. Iso805N]|uniref:class F sortase n=1 Tax=Nocardioides sp. Iso805N TaxID=1283287 RepID=UPI00035D77F7|nr:class F sortase [Nocardioides sp. Iso805N]
MRHAAVRGSRRRWLLLGSILAGSALVTGAAVSLVTTATDHPAGPVDMTGHRVQVDAGTTLSPRAQKAMHAVADTGTRFLVPSVGLDVPLGALDVVDNTITPPGVASVYWVRNLGVSLADARQGTVFLATHSMRGGAVAPGNYLINVAEGTSALSAGAKIVVGGLTYTVTSTQAITKAQVPHDAALWANTPGRLVVITCLEVPAGTDPVENMVITASLT